MQIHRRAELSVACIAAVLTIPGAYAVQRLADVAFRSEANPATVTPSSTIAMFWRVVIGIYLAPVVGFLAFEAARRDLGRTVERLYIAAYVVAALVTAQAIVTP